MKADSVRKLNRTKKDQVTDTAPLDARPEEVPSDRTHTKEPRFPRPPFFRKIGLRLEYLEL